MNTIELEERTLWNRLKHKMANVVNRSAQSTQSTQSFSRTFGIAIVGAGNVVRWKYVPQLLKRSNYRPLYVYDLDVKTSQSVAKLLNCRAANDLEQILADPAVDILCICTPPGSHAGIAKMAIKAGKHIICEKPMARTLFEAQDMFNAVQNTSCVNMVHFAYRFNPDWRLVHQIIASGMLGSLYTVWGTLSQGGWFDPDHRPSQERVDAAGWRYDSEGGIIAEMGSHLVDLCRWCFGEVAEVRALNRTCGVKAGEATSEDLCAMTLRFAGGCVAHLQVSRLATGFKERTFIEIYGSQGALRVDQGSVSLWTRFEPRWRTLLLPKHESGEFLDVFYRAVVDPRRIHMIPTFEDGLKNNKILHALDHSSKTGMPQLLDDE